MSIDWNIPGTFTGSEMKIHYKDHFLWVGRYKKDTTFIDNYGGGTSIINGNHLEQEILYAGAQSMVETRIRILRDVKNDTATQTWTCDENWQVIKNDYGIQKWVRMK